MSFRNTQSTSS